jgi:hypothetical protein
LNRSKELQIVMNDNPYQAPQEQSQKRETPQERASRAERADRLLTRLSLGAIAVFCAVFVVWVVQRMFIGE